VRDRLRCVSFPLGAGLPQTSDDLWHWNNETSWWCDESFRCRSRKFSVLSFFFSLPSTLASRWHDTRCMTRLFISKDVNNKFSFW
jgi:hypothetical protein